MSRKARVLTAVAIVFLVVVIAAVAWLYPIFTVKQVNYEGQQHTTVEELEGAVGEVTGQNFLRVNTNQIATKVAALPWVAETKVSKQFPSTINVHIVEHQAVLYAPRSDGDHLVDTNGVTFVIEPHPEGAVAVTNTTEDDQEFFKSVISVLEAIGDENQSEIAEVRLAGSDSVEILLHDGRVIFWGASENNHDKAVAFGVALSRAEQELDISGAPVIAVR